MSSAMPGLLHPGELAADAQKARRAGARKFAANIGGAPATAACAQNGPAPAAPVAGRFRE